jgi:eukaryotic-like serine/threonine-protein kinase
MNRAELLLGTTLPTGWYVYEKLNKKSTSSGGNFSVQYKVRKNNQNAFLKVVDISRALRMPNVMAELQVLTNTHIHECNILSECRTYKMDRVIQVIDNGEIPASDKDPIPIPIPFVIFELAEGTIRDQLNVWSKFDNAFTLRSLHNLFVGTSQLHNNQIAHQDIKPSNITLHEGSSISKLADLGRSDKRGVDAPHTRYVIAGDPSYAPIEQQYGFSHAEWTFRRQTCDLYLLGSMIVFYFQQTSMTNLIKAFLPSAYHWNNWQGRSYEEVLPFVIDAFDNACTFFADELKTQFSDQGIVHELENMVRSLCYPEPEKRGHGDYQTPLFKGNRLSLEKYISRLDALASSAEKII